MEGNKEDSYAPFAFYQSREQLYGALRGFFSIKEYDFVVDLIDQGSVWTLLLVLLESKFSGDYSVKDKEGNFVFLIRNSEICWHFDAIAKGILNGNSDLGSYYGDQYAFPFSFNSGMCGYYAQAKLFHSLLVFCINASKQGFDKIYEAGGGDELGGDNHRMVANVLNDIEINMTIHMIDPMHNKTDDEVIGGVTLVHDKNIVALTSSYDAPVFFDVFDHGTYLQLQQEVNCPMRMTKHLSYNKESDVLLQPYHTEFRVMKNKQLPFLLVSFHTNITEFDNCRDCVVWKAMFAEYRLLPELVARQFPYNAIPLCRPVIGAGTVHAMLERRNEKMSNLQDTYDLPELTKRVVNLSKDPIQRGLTTWESNVIACIEQIKIKCCEVSYNPNYLFAEVRPDLFQADGVPLYYDFTDFPESMEKCCVIVSEVNRVNCEKALDLRSLDIVECVNVLHLYFYYCVNSLLTGPIFPKVIEIHEDWNIASRVITLPCANHGYNNKCFGFKCGRSGVFAVQVDNRTMFGKFVTNPRIDSKILYDRFINYTVPKLSKESVEKYLKQFEVLEFIKNLGPITKFQIDCIEGILRFYVLDSKIEQGVITVITSNHKFILFPLSISVEMKGTIAGDKSKLSANIVFESIDAIDFQRFAEGVETMLASCRSPSYNNSTGNQTKIKLALARRRSKRKGKPLSRMIREN